MKFPKLMLMVILTLLVCSTSAMATVYFTPAFDVNDLPTESDPLTGSRSLSGGGLKVIEGSDPYATSEVSWVIFWNGTSWDFTYDFSGFGHDISHVTVDVSDAYASLDSGLIVNNEVTVFGVKKTPDFSAQEIIGAFKVEEFGDDNYVGFSMEFLSINAPVWGDMYMKDGQHFDIANYYYNAHSATDSICGYIPVPDTVPTTTIVPEPTTLLLFVSGLLGLVGLGAKKKQS